MPINTVTWLITGASSGYGLALARYAIDCGYHVVATARSVAKLAALAALAPERVLVQRLDVTLADDAETAVKAAIARFGRIDVLINNAGYGMIGAVEETPEAEFRAQMDTNFFGALSVTKAALPYLRAQKSGAIVNVSSMGGQMSFAGASAYSASKFALEGLSEALAHEVAPFGIKVLIVEPGALRTNFSAGSALKLMPAMDAYQDILGSMRALVHDMHGSQEGDPAKAARALDLALQADNPPLRLQVGADSIAAVRAHAEQLLRDLAIWENRSARTSASSPVHLTKRGRAGLTLQSVMPSREQNSKAGAPVRGPVLHFNAFGIRPTGEAFGLNGRKAPVVGGTKGIGAP